MEIPAWALSISYWLHMLATVFWLGGLAAAGAFVLPLIASQPSPGEQLSQLQRLQKRLDPLGWFCLALLTGTGLVQMSGSAQYVGFLSIANDWALAILLKHIIFFGMIGVSVFLTWKALPDLSRAVLLQAHGKLSPEALKRIFRQQAFLLRTNLVLGLVVLIFTAMARVAA